MLSGAERVVDDPEDVGPFVQAAVELISVVGPDTIATGASAVCRRCATSSVWTGSATA
ncbi:MAG: hypothetical protein H6737_13955 [Alphaproteobacteria bacterium]|nr:hypothetical protein [Alphaproteobacteria bacterium]